ncbi:hypothetical protein EGK_17278 [Macaca mulatta]|uniref:Uncharacterized protein n=1 Tax=Macaca mulatta TaxID=9544 RepID=G7MW74_MACMU|nr:hypothetical protein EGK_17278 [Macaca mulatta]
MQGGWFARKPPDEEIVGNVLQGATQLWSQTRGRSIRPSTAGCVSLRNAGSSARLSAICKRWPQNYLKINHIKTRASMNQLLRIAVAEKGLVSPWFLRPPSSSCHCQGLLPPPSAFSCLALCHLLWRSHVFV